MQLSFLLVAFFAFFASFAAAAVMPRASHRPSCYSCPLVDKKGGLLDIHKSDGLHCVYKYILKPGFTK